MPALPAVPKTLKLSLNYTYQSDTSAGSRIFITYAGGSPTSAQLSTFCTAVRTAWNANLAGLHQGNVILTSVFAEDLNSSSGAIGLDNTPVSGTRAGGGVPAGTCLMIQHLIARRYRGGKPKSFLPFGVASDLNTAQTWTAAFVNACITGWTNFIAAVIAAPWAAGGPLTQSNVSYYSGFTVVTNPITHRARNVPTLRGTPVIDTVTAFNVETGIASQRRRNLV